jgi:hypothetical protein
MKTVGTKLDNSEYEIFEYCCAERGLTKSEQLRTLIKGFVDEEPKIETTTELEETPQPTITIVDVD